MEINGLTILMGVFALWVFLAGLYLYTGHRCEILLRKVHNIQKLSLKELQNIGKRTMISSWFIFLIAIVSMFLEV